MLALQQEQQSKYINDRQIEPKKGREISKPNGKKNEALNHDSSSLFSIDGGSVDDLTEVSYAESAKPSRHYNAPLYKVENTKANGNIQAGAKKRVSDNNYESQTSARGNGSQDKLIVVEKRKSSPRMRRDRGRESDDEVETNMGLSNNDRRARVNRIRRDRGRESDDEGSDDEGLRRDQVRSFEDCDALHLQRQ
jgi:hypothetical protein